MSLYVPSRKYDVFVSYAHVNNEPPPIPGEHAGWVTTLVRFLKQQLAEKLGRRDRGRVWFDDSALRRHVHITPDIREAVRQSATLIAILSQGYLESESCQDELETFCQAAGKTEGRIFLVLYENVERELERGSWPRPFQDLKGYEFFEVDEEEHRTMGWPILLPDERLYYRRLRELTRDLARQLKALQGETGEPRQAVFLGEATPDLDESRDVIARSLDQDGWRVLPEKWYPRAPAAFQDAMKRDLADSILFVQLLGPHPSRKTLDLPAGYEGLQLELARAEGKPILQWRDRELDLGQVKDPEHRALLEGQEVIAESLGVFFRRLKQRLRLLQERLTEVPRESPRSVPGAFVLVNGEKVDNPLADQLTSILESHEVGYEVSNRDELPIPRLIEEPEYDGLMILYGRCAVEWVRQQLLQLRKLMSRCADPPPICAIYKGPPVPKEPLRFNLPGVELVDCSAQGDESKLRGFINRVQERSRR